jgi:hypothetical protein
MRSCLKLHSTVLRTGLLAVALLPVPAMWAGDAPVFHTDAHRVSVFGADEFEADTGMFASFEIASTTQQRPAINYEFQTVRLGWMLGDVKGSGIWRGNGEFLLGAYGGPVTQGPGGGLFGWEFILRYNFLPENSRFRPFAQLGAGGLYNDIYKTGSQIVIGSGFEFMLHAGFGTHIMLGDHWALNLEADFRHISNADTASRNGGLNSLGGTVGFSYFFN